MPSDVKFNATLRAIEVIHTGFVSEDDLRKCTADAIAIHLEQCVNEVLIDAVELESFDSFFDVYERPMLYAAAGVSRSIQIAVMSPRLAKAQEFINFYDNICYNRGWRIEQFKTRDDAVEWLSLSEPS